MKPLFIPLKSLYYDAFASGIKTVEYRPYGARWNERTCPIGRPVTLSKGYGKRHRLQGRVIGFRRSRMPTRSRAWRDCYGERAGEAACIRIEVQLPGEPHAQER